jgi:hypothetical protein
MLISFQCKNRESFALFFSILVEIKEEAKESREEQDEAATASQQK